MRIKRQMLAFGIPAFEQGQEFEPLPMHLTLVPWFEGARYHKLTQGLEKLAKRTRPIHVVVGESAMFGAQRDVPVRRMEENEALQNLHSNAMLVISYANGDLGDVIGEIGYRYEPHIANRGDVALADSYDLSSLALISDAGRHRRHIDRVFALNG